MIKADFHTHSTCSDGLLSPREMVKRAKENGVSYYALTDHDTTLGLDEAFNEAKKLNINFIPGIELSTNYNNESIHILGYFKDNSYNDKDLLNFLDKLKNRRITRAKEMINKLKSEFNIDISFENTLKRSNGVIARPHIAHEIIDSGYKYTLKDIFEKLIGNGCKAYVPTTKISTKEGINLLKKHNALVFLAHPFLIKKSPISDFLKMNFDGIEAIYFQNTNEFEKEITKTALKNNLLISTGSDFHGDLENDVKHGDIGCISDRYSEVLLKKFMEHYNM